MNVKALRTQRNWSQEQLAHFSGLSIRTIQRTENNEKVALESLKSLAAVFEISLTELKQEQNMTTDTLNTANEVSNTQTVTKPRSKTLTEEQHENAKKHVDEVKGFYKMLIIYVVSFLIWPFFALVDESTNNDAWWMTLYMGCVYLGIIAIHANNVFKPFGEKWQKKQEEKFHDDQ